MKTPAERNLELTLEEVRAQIVVESETLSEILETQKLEIAHTKDVCGRLWEEVAEERNSLQSIRLELEQREHSVIELEARKTRELAVLKQQIRDGMSELARLNAWIATADADYEAKTGILGRLDAEIAAKISTTEGILILRDQLGIEETALEAFRLNATLEHADATARLEKLLTLTTDAEQRRDAARADALAAVKENDAVRQDTARIQRDLGIYIRRVEEKYNEAFPNLRMTI